MALTVQYVVDRAREVLNDADGTRYTDPQLFAYIGEAYHIARRVRPDMFVYRYGSTINAPTALTDVLRTPDSVAEAVAHYVTGRAEFRDDEFSVDGRAMSLMGKFESVLIKGV
jgi:hypothetical protein